MDNSETVTVTEEEAKEKQKHQSDDYFNRLPDEVVITIFNRLVDLKLLFHCSIVSKRFSSLIPNIHSISFSVPPRNPNPNPNPNPNSNSNSNPNPEVDHDHQHQHQHQHQNQNLPKKLFRFLLNDVVSKPLRFIRQIVRPRPNNNNKPLPSSISAFYGDAFRSSVCFLGKFREIRSLEIKLPSSSTSTSTSTSTSIHRSELIKWRVKFGIKLESFLFISPTSLHEFNQFNNNGFDNGEQEEEEEEELINTNVLKHRVHLAFQCLKDAVVRHRMLLFLIEQHPMLQSVVISESNKQGLLSVSNDQLVELRNLIKSLSSVTAGWQLRSSIEVPVTVKEWYVPLLKLPLSGYVMEGAILVVMGMVDSGDDDVTLAASFDGDEDPFGEAVTEIMVNHRSKMKRLL